jgi:glutamate 5-kinase
MTKNKKRVVIKIGTSIWTESSRSAGGSVLPSLVEEICGLRSEGAEVLLVTSGAIGAGVKELNWERRPEDIKKKQAAAAVGQVSLMQTYQNLFRARGVLVAQVLLTRGDFDDRKRYLNARSTLLTLLDLGVVPVINENDTVSVEEIQFGDNDRLSALVAAKIDADLLIILSDVDGLLRPASGGEKEIVPLVPKISSEIEKLAWKGRAGGVGTGGMASKIEAAKVATQSGVTVVVANGSRPRVLADILEGKSVGTKFVSAKSLSARGKWILFGAVPKGEIVIDQGAASALKESKKSLLAAGVLKVQGHFRKGEIVKITRDGREEIARGVVSFSSEDIEKIKGKKSEEIKGILGSSRSSEIVHRDQLVLLP